MENQMSLPKDCKISPTDVCEGHENKHDCNDLFIDGICILTGTVDLTVFIRCVERKFKTTIDPSWKTSHSLYNKTIKGIYQHICIDSHFSLDDLIEHIVNYKKDNPTFSRHDETVKHAIAINNSLSTPLRDIVIIMSFIELLGKRND